MAFTADEQEHFFQECYGCNPHEFKQSVKDSLTFEFGGMKMAITSILSDVQEMIARDMKEEARQYLNRVKFLINEE